MIEMDNIVTIVCLIGAALLTFVLGKAKLSKKRRGVQTPPKNTAADVARETVQQTLEEAISGIKKDTESEDAADKLAARGNARKRRKK